MPKRTPKTEGATVTDISKPKRAKQGELPGVEAPSHPELDALMEEHASQSEVMGSARQRLGELNTQLQQEAKKLGVTTYRHPTAVPTLTLTVTEGTTKVKVKKAKPDVEVDEGEATA